MDQGLKDTINQLKKASEVYLPKKTDDHHDISPPTGKYADKPHTTDELSIKNTFVKPAEQGSNTATNNGGNETVPQNAQPATVEEIIKPEKTLLEFDTIDRLTSEITQYSLRKIAFFAIFVAIVFLILQDWWMIMVVVAIYFVVYVYFSAPAHKMHHLITSHGINFNGEHLYKWDEFTSFYIDNKDNQDIAVITAKLAIPGRLYIILPKEVDTRHFSEILNSFISITKKPEDTFIDKIMNFVGKKIKV